MDIELEKRINEAVEHLREMTAEAVDYQIMDPIAKMMLVALLHETQKIRDYIGGIEQKLTDRFCEDFIPREQVSAMPAISLVAPTFKKNKDLEAVSVGKGVSFTYKVAGNKNPISFIPLFKNTLIPYEDIYILTQNKLISKEKSFDVSMEHPNTLWVGIKTKVEIESLDGFSLYIQNVVDVYPEQISVVGSETTEIDFCTMNRIDEIEMMEPFDAQQVSNSFISIVEYWRRILKELPNGVLLYFNDKCCDRDIFKKKAYPRIFQNWLESEVLDCLSDDTLWLQVAFPENYKLNDNCNVVINTMPIVNIDINSVTLTQVSPVAKLQKQEDSFFLSVLETSNASRKQGFSSNSDEFVIRDFDACCYHHGDLYRDIRNLYNHFIEDYYAFIEYNNLKDGQDIKRLKELVNKIGKSVGEQNDKFKFDSGTFVMKNINQPITTTVTRVSYLTTQGEQGNLLTFTNEKDSSSKLECKNLPMIKNNVPIVVPAMGGRNKATADQRYELIRYYSLTNDRLYTKMDIEAFVRKELITIYGKKKFKRILINVHIEGTAGKDAVERGVYVDIEFKDNKNYILAIEKNLEAKFQRQIINKSCIAMPIIVTLINLESLEK